ncbi:hypothetical protein [Foetidibacter luteolus]|uniref:hypothetical protein n=1 Tax=Foetidibacter luteolus TaxID=2608880 RepID=UPI00129AF880|nr:hypothetical protein [Foetidibacter luteolus]
MNIINTALLRLVLLPAPLYNKMGVNSRHLKAILGAKLTMDDRRPNTFQQLQRNRDSKPVKLATLVTMLWSALMGAFFLVSFRFGSNNETQLTTYFIFYIAILASVLIADFTSVLIDIRDNYIILPRPVSDKTFVLARLLHIAIHVCKMVLPMLLPGAIYMGLNYNAGGVAAFLLMAFMATLFTIFLINACYIFILKITTPEKFRNIISYIQIFFAVVFYAGFQLAPRLINMAALQGFDINQHQAAWLLPPYWFAGAWQQLYSFSGNARLLTCLALAIAVPPASTWVVIKYFAPSFNRKLSMISGSGAEAGQPRSVATPAVKSASSAYSGMLAGLLTKKGAERMAFLFTWKMMLRSRDFKMKVYPAIGYIIVILFVIVFTKQSFSIQDIRLQNNQGIITSLMVIYFSNIILMSAISQVTMHEKFKAGWIFFTTPIQQPGRLISGSVKAVIAQFFIPIMLVIIICLTVLAGFSILPNILFGMANQLLITAVVAYITATRLPFTSPQQNDAGNNLFRVFAVMLLGGLLGIGHFVLYRIPAVIGILTILSALAAWLVLDGISRQSWKKIISRYQD